MIEILCMSYSLSRRWNNSYQSSLVSITVKLVLQYKEMFCGVQDEQLRSQNTSLRHSWHHVNQFASTTNYQDIQWPIREKWCQNRQHRTSNSHRSELEENPFDGWPSKSITEVDLNNSTLLTPMHPVGCVRHTKGMISAKNFPISKFGWLENGSTPRHSINCPS